MAAGRLNKCIADLLQLTRFCYILSVVECCIIVISEVITLQRRYSVAISLPPV